MYIENTQYYFCWAALKLKISKLYTLKVIYLKFHVSHTIVRRNYEKNL